MKLSRRDLVFATTTAALSPLLSLVGAEAAIPRLRINGFELLPIRATARTVALRAHQDGQRTDGARPGVRRIRFREYDGTRRRSDAVRTRDVFRSGRRALAL
jgi:hypothetical protein